MVNTHVMSLKWVGDLKKQVTRTARKRVYTREEEELYVVCDKMVQADTGVHQPKDGKIIQYEVIHGLL